MVYILPAVVLLCAPQTLRTLSTKPTVLHVVADDLGYADLGYVYPYPVLYIPPEY